MKILLLIVVLIFITAEVWHLYLKYDEHDNYTWWNENKKQLNNRIYKPDTSLNITSGLENIGLSNEALNKILHIKQEDDIPFRFYTDINFRVGFIGGDKYNSSFIGVTYNHLCFHSENFIDTAYSATPDNCIFLSNNLDTLILQHNITNDCIDDFINTKSNFLKDTIENIFMHGY